MSAVSSPGRAGGLAGDFKFAERGTNLATEARGGLTTFMVMAYIVFVNASILSAGLGFDRAVGAATALIAGIMTIAMGVVANYPFALAAGLGINAIVAFRLDRPRASRRRARWASSSSRASRSRVLVLVGFREAVMNAVPLVAEASDRRGHRPVHPVHRLRQRRADRRRRVRAASRAGRVRSFPTTAGAVRLPRSAC